MSLRRRSFCTPALLIVLGSGLAWAVQTAGGSIAIEEVRFPGSDGVLQYGRLYVPEGVTREAPAPGIVAIHGYINSNETQSGFAIEFARRGWVVLAVDQTGHGYSDPPVGINGYGGPASLAFLHSLDIVDSDNIGLEGHSMGGWASLAAAQAFPDGYRSIVLEGSSVGVVSPASGSPPTRNVAVVFSRFDEFSSLMWGVPVAGDVASAERLQDFFGTNEPVVPGRIYGSVDRGTARVLHQPPVTHPGDHLSRAAIGHAVAWFQTTLDGGDDLPPSDQIWYWKELGTLVALVGMVLLLFPTASFLLGAGFFFDLREPPGPARGAQGGSWWVAAAVFTALPALTLFPFKGLANPLGLEASAWLPQDITTQLVVWTSLLGLISVTLFGVWHWIANRGEEHAADAYGITWNGRLEGAKIGKSFLLALLIVSAAYGSLVLTDFFFQTDYRFWVFGVKLLSPLQLRIAISYLLPFTAFFLVLGLLLHGQLRKGSGSAMGEMFRNVVLLVGGFVGLLVFQYVPLLAGGTLAIPTEPLWTIIAFQFVPIMTIVALISTYLFRQTGRIYAGAFASGLLVTWIVVASQATHHPF